MNLKHNEKISGIKKTIDILLDSYDEAMELRDWELAINIGYLIDEQLELLGNADNVLEIQTQYKL
jgi:hypothetical protein